MTWANNFLCLLILLFTYVILLRFGLKISVSLIQMDAKLPIDIFENVMQLAVEGCKAVANYIREVLLEHTKQLEYRRGP